MLKTDQQQPDNAVSVSELTLRIQSVLEKTMRPLWVVGEISNLRNYDGSLYFTLKDNESQIPGVMLKYVSVNLTFMPQNGMSVRVFGDVQVYVPNGRYQLRIKMMEPEGQGDLHRAFEQLKAKLAAEGLFESSRKRPLPRFPQKIGVVTSEVGAAIQDIRNIISRRYPLVKLLLYSVRVQGQGSAEDIVRGIRFFSDMPPSARPDLMIVGRGGGSIEDLWSFNEEIVARAIAASSIPVVSAVGHEIDFTISDFVADLRAPTPSGAAEIVVPDVQDLRRQIAQHTSRLERASRTTTARYRERLQRYESSGLFRPLNEIQNRMIRMDLILEKMIGFLTSKYQKSESDLQKMAKRLEQAGPEARLMKTKYRLQTLTDRLRRFDLAAFRHRTHVIETRLSGFDPRKILGRGYAICSRRDGTVVQSSMDVEEHDEVRVELSQGELHCEVKDRRFL